MMDVISSIQGVVWGPIMLVLLFGTHVFLTLRTRVIQRYVFKGIKLSVTPDKEASGDVSGFGALATALAATLVPVTSSASLQRSHPVVPVRYSGYG